jgi:hypothetical protein
MTFLSFCLDFIKVVQTTFQQWTQATLHTPFQHSNKKPFARQRNSPKFSLTLATALGLITLLPLSWAQFASLTLIPNGEPQLDISTNITTWPQGGTIIDKSRGITLTAGVAEFKDGVYIKAQGTTAEGFFGVLDAPEFYFDMASNVITTSGGIALSQGGLSLSANQLTLHLANGIAVLSGNVNNASPNFQAATLILKLGAGYGLLVSPFNYQDVLSKDEAGSLIQLNQTQEADKSFTYSISTTPDDSVHAELSPYIP